MKLIYTALLIVSFAFSQEIKIGNKHIMEYANPFKGIFKDKKHGDINIQVKNEILKIKVETDKDLGGYMNYGNTSYELNKNSIKNTVHNILKDQYNLVSTGLNVGMALNTLFRIGGFHVLDIYQDQLMPDLLEALKEG